MSLEYAERLDHYLEQCNQSEINRLARRKCSYTVWNDQSLAQKATLFLRNLTDLKEIPSVIILNPSADGGMPHTRASSIICLPAYYPETKLEETLKHELVHINQKQNPSAWIDRAEREGWVYIPQSRIPEIWRERCRLNPDTISARFFAWKGRYIPLPLFIREDKPELREIQVRWYDLIEETVNSHTPTSFTQKYGTLGASSIEHPYELWAYHP